MAKAGFYVFREQIAGSPLVAAVRTACAQTSETSLGVPSIITGGRGPFSATAVSSSALPTSTPVSVKIASLGVSAPVDASAIDLATGQLAVPANIHRTGWWVDRAAPGDRTGTVLIAGHVDSAALGAGAFYPLKSAAPGAIVTVTTRSGRTVRYRVTRVQTILKAELPLGIFTRTGRPRLVLVTCGEPSDQQTGHYLDNVIVYATPVYSCRPAWVAPVGGWVAPAGGWVAPAMWVAPAAGVRRTRRRGSRRQPLGQKPLNTPQPEG